jgi:D-glycero-alpha-D-manno-heptose-7-phosphate kinase
MRKPIYQGMEILSQAPTRISFAGGGTDISPYCDDYGGAVVSGTLSIFMLARLRLRDDSQVKIHVNTRPKPLVYEDVNHLEFDGKLDFVKAIVHEIHPLSTGFDLYFHSSLGIGSGLGGSAAMCVAILGAFNHLREYDRLNNYQLAELAYKIETEILGNASGRQDQYAAAFGGLNHIEFNGNDYVRVSPIDISVAGSRALNQSLMLFWLGERPASGDIIVDQVRGVRDSGKALEALHETKRAVGDMKLALKRVDVRTIGAQLDELWQLKKQFSRHVSNPWIDEVYDRLREAGMLGGKVTGAGGGGHLMACCEIHRKDELLAEAQDMGIRHVPFSFVHEGVLTWESPVRIVPNGSTETDDTLYIPAESEQNTIGRPPTR